MPIIPAADEGHRRPIGSDLAEINLLELPIQSAARLLYAPTQVDQRLPGVIGRTYIGQNAAKCAEHGSDTALLPQFMHRHDQVGKGAFPACHILPPFGQGPPTEILPERQSALHGDDLAQTDIVADQQGIPPHHLQTQHTAPGVSDQDQRILPIGPQYGEHEPMNVLDHGTDGDRLIRSEGIVGETTATLIQVDETEVLLKLGVIAHGQGNAGITRTTMQIEDDGSLARSWIHGKNQTSAVDSGLVDVRATTNLV